MLAVTTTIIIIIKQERNINVYDSARAALGFPTSGLHRGATFSVTANISHIRLPEFGHTRAIDPQYLFAVPSSYQTGV